MTEWNSSHAQGNFVNLNFEQAKIIPEVGNPYYPEGVATTNAAPGWTAYIDGFVQPWVIYNDISLGSPWISIHDTNEPASSLKPIQGNYSIYFQSINGIADLGQTAQIPVAAQSLTFWARSPAFQITFAGQFIPYITLGSGANYTIHGSDISSLAGQTGELRFSGGGLLDNIQFSAQAIPEPNGLALLGLGALLLGFFRRRNSSR